MMLPKSQWKQLGNLLAVTEKHSAVIGDCVTSETKQSCYVGEEWGKFKTNLYGEQIVVAGWTYYRRSDESAFFYETEDATPSPADRRWWPWVRRRLDLTGKWDRTDWDNAGQDLMLINNETKIQVNQNPRMMDRRSFARLLTSGSSLIHQHEWGLRGYKRRERRPPRRRGPLVEAWRWLTKGNRRECIGMNGTRSPAVEDWARPAKTKRNRRSDPGDWRNPRCRRWRIGASCSGEEAAWGIGAPFLSSLDMILVGGGRMQMQRWAGEEPWFWAPATHGSHRLLPCVRVSRAGNWLGEPSRWPSRIGWGWDGHRAHRVGVRRMDWVGLVV
jgi:hypothetical protein